MRWHTVEDLGPTQAFLPSGSLLARNVPIARTGVQHYHASELPMDVAAGSSGAETGGMVTVRRDPDEVFHPRAVASFEGVPITMAHPIVGVDTDNWQGTAVGHVQNVRRGDPPDDNLLVADLIIHDRRAIDAVRNQGWKGVSCGYDAKYLPLGRGMAKQTNIIGNHVAILPPGMDARCGGACMIGDSAWPRKESTMDIWAKWIDATTEIGLAASETQVAGATPGAAGGGKAGSREVMRLPHAGYYVSQVAGPDGGYVALFETVDPNTRSDPGEVGNGSNTRAMTGDARQRAARDAYIADRERSTRILAETNKRNRAFWHQEPDHRHSA